MEKRKSKSAVAPVYDRRQFALDDFAAHRAALQHRKFENRKSQDENQ